MLSTIITLAGSGVIIFCLGWVIGVGDQRRIMRRAARQDATQLRASTFGTPEYFAAIEAAMTAARYSPERRNALKAGFLLHKREINVYWSATNGWYVQEWPYNTASVPLAEWQPSAAYLALFTEEDEDNAD